MHRNCECHSVLGDGPSDPPRELTDAYGNPVDAPISYDQEAGGTAYDTYQNYWKENRIVATNDGRAIVVPQYVALDPVRESSIYPQAPAPAPAPAPFAEDRMVPLIRSPQTGALVAEGDRAAGGNFDPIGPASPIPVAAPSPTGSLAPAPAPVTVLPGVQYPWISYEARPGAPQEIIHPQQWVAEQTGDGPVNQGGSAQASKFPLGAIAALALLLLS